MRRWLSATLCPLLVIAAAVAGGCGGDDDDEPSPPPPDPETVERPAPDERTPPATGRLDFANVETIAEGLEVPWGLAFAGPETILVTERPGRVRVIEDGELRDDPIAEIADVTHQGEGGLLGIALHPDFPDRRAGYLYYTAGDENRISRFRVGDDLSFGDEEVLLRAPAASVHNGGHIAFGPDGLLYASTGEVGEPALAADPSSLAGKIIRLRPDGAPAGADAFEGSPVVSFGHRNPQGFDWDGEGRLYSSEHGPSGDFGLCCHDEVNLIEDGEFYGWPFLAGAAPAQEGDPPQPPVAPIAASGAEDTWAPAGLAVHEPTGERTELLISNLAGEELMRVALVEGEPREVDAIETAIDDLGRLRAAVLGPDGCLYLTTSNTDGRGDPRGGDDRVARVCERGD